LHRDIKPSNVMVFDELGERDRAKLLDFGIAKGVTVGATDDTALTMTGFVIGTPGYMSPEQALGRPVTRASDLFSAGLIAYEMLIGQSPFRGLSMEQLQRRLMSSPLRLPGTVRVGEDFERVLNRMLAIDADERYETAAGALADLGLAEPAPSPKQERPATPRPANLLTFPMQLDSSGSTIVDTLADRSRGETATIMLPGADNQHPVSDTAETEETTAPTEERAPKADSTVVGPARTERRYGLIVWIVLLVAAVVAILAWGVGSSSTGDDGTATEPSDVATPTPEPKADPTPEPAPAPQIGPAVDAAHEILARANRNAELDAEIRAKELMLRDGGDAESPSTEEAPRPATPDSETTPRSETREEREPLERRRPERREETRPKPKPKPKKKPAKRDFDVTPLDEL
jgi:serine/threonine-protein kinase